MKSAKSFYSKQQQAQRRADLPQLNYPEALPIVEAKAQIAKLITEHQLVIIAGETGSGKTTQLPKICLEVGRGITGQIAHTQPRRIAAKSVANRIAEELQVSLGSEVGYQVRFDDQSSKNGYIKLMTDGILLNQLQQDPLLRQYDTIIIDEAHERSLNIDFLLGILRNLLPKRPDLKVIITSATIDPEKFAKYFNDAPMLKVEGRSYPVQVLYQGLSTDAGVSLEVEQGVLNALNQLKQQAKTQGHLGDTLVFLATEQEIRQVHKYLKKQLTEHIQILPLYGRLSSAQQMRIFKSEGRPRIVLATNIAETSLTVPGIHYVIDAGTARISRYSIKSKVQRLPIEKISKASADQRKGRCGRIAPGICIRLYDQEDFEARADYTEPEILRTNLASVILQMKLMRLPAIEQFPFIEPPQNSAINDGFKLLYELKAIDKSRKLTSLGHKMARLPIDPKLAAMLVNAQQFNAVHELLIITAVMSVQDPRERPHEAQQQADQLHQRFVDKRSDFVSLLNLWHYFTQQKSEGSWNHLRKLCKSELINFNRMREWREIYAQLKQLIIKLNIKINKQAADYQQIHQALLTGYLSQVANRMPEGELKGTRNTQLYIFPGSSLKAKKNGELADYPLPERDIAINNNWLVAAELMETSKTFARTAALIDPNWIIDQAKHLVKYQYTEPFWSKKAARATVKRSTSLYGLVIKANERVSLASIDAEQARELFIVHALIRQEYATNNKIIKQNWHNQQQAEQLEERFRRRDIVVSEQQLVEHYQPLLDASIHNGKAFEFWFRQLPKAQKERFILSSEQLIKLNEQQLQTNDFPTEINVQSQKLAVDYKFKPDQVDDGVHIDIPLALLPQLTEQNFDWQVPGLIKDKLEALLRALPKPIRRQLVPIPDFAKNLMPELSAEKGSLYQQVANAIRNKLGRPFDESELRELTIEQRYQPTFHVVDTANNGNRNKAILASGKNLDALKNQLSDALSETFNPETELQTYQGFPEVGFNLTETINKASINSEVYPGIELLTGEYCVKQYTEQVVAEQATRIALLSLLCDVKQDKLLVSTLNELNAFMLSYGLFPEHAIDLLNTKQPLARDLSLAIANQVIGEQARSINSHGKFELLQRNFRQQLIPTALTLVPLLTEILKQLKLFNQQLKQLSAPSQLKVQQRLNKRVHQLLYQGFICQAGLEQLKQYPRYLKACVYRAEQAILKPELEEQRDALWQKWWLKWSQNNSSKDTNLNHVPFNPQEVGLQAVNLRWLIEEFHVATFAQQLGTKQKVSEKRLKAVFS